MDHQATNKLEEAIKEGKEKPLTKETLDNSFFFSLDEKQINAIWKAQSNLISIIKHGHLTHRFSKYVNALDYIYNVSNEIDKEGNKEQAKAYKEIWNFLDKAFEGIKNKPFDIYQFAYILIDYDIKRFINNGVPEGTHNTRAVNNTIMGYRAFFKHIISAELKNL